MPQNLIKLKPVKLLSLVAIASFSLVITACGDGENSTSTKPQKESLGLDNPDNTLLQVGKEVFSIPSPIQTAFLIKKSGASFDRAIISDIKNSSLQTTKFSKSLNLGVYGADIGYVTLYGQSQSAIDIIAICRNMSADLGVSNAFNPELMANIEKNIENKDKMLSLITEAYFQGDAFLKSSESHDISTLIIAGGWVEGLYLATKVMETNPNVELKNRIAEQKNSVSNLIKMVNSNVKINSEEGKEFVALFNDLSNAFNKVEFTYTYEKPVTDATNKVTKINSSSKVEMSPEVLKDISEKVAKLRNAIVS